MSSFSSRSAPNQTTQLQPAKKSNKPRIITWIPFPVWFSLSVEGFGVITDYLVIEMGTSVGKWWCPFFCEKKTRSLEIFQTKKKGKRWPFTFPKKDTSLIHCFEFFFLATFILVLKFFNPQKGFCVDFCESKLTWHLSSRLGSVASNPPEKSCKQPSPFLYNDNEAPTPWTKTRDIKLILCSELFVKEWYCQHQFVYVYIIAGINVIYIYIHKYLYVFIYANVKICVYVNTYICVYIHIYVHM